MRFQATRGELLDSLELAASVAPGRTPKPALQCVLLRADTSSVEVAASDGEIFARQTLREVQVEQAGDCLVSAEKLFEVVKGCGDDSLSFRKTGDRLTVVGCEDTFNLNTQDARQFPGAYELQEPVSFTCEAKDLHRLISRASVATGVTKNGPTDGVYVVAESGRVKCVGGDDRRVSYDYADADTTGKAEAIVSNYGAGKCVKAVLRALKSGGRVTVSVGHNGLRVDGDDRQVQVPIMAGTYPFPPSVVEKKTGWSQRAIVSKTFADKVRRAKLLTTELTSRVQFEVGSRGVRMTTANPDSGESDVYYACKVEGGEVSIGLNPSYLLDGLGVMDGEDISVEFNGPTQVVAARCGNFSFFLAPIGAGEGK